MNLKQRAKQLKTDIPAIFLSLSSKKTPRLAKIFSAITIVYALSPIDLIPDFIPVIGYFDDLIILPALIAITIRLIPSEVLEEFRVKSKQMQQNIKEKNWLYAIPIFLIWVGVAVLIFKMIIF